MGLPAGMAAETVLNPSLFRAFRVNGNFISNHTPRAAYRATVSCAAAASRFFTCGTIPPLAMMRRMIPGNGSP